MSTEARRGRRKATWIATGAATIVLLAGAAGWGGSLLANSAAAESSLTAGPTAPSSTPSGAATPTPSAPADAVAPQAAASVPGTTRANTRTPAQAPVPAPAPAPAPAPGPAPGPASAPPPVAVPQPPAVNCSMYLSLKEQNRVTYQAKLANLNIQFNQALNSGDPDQAAMYYTNASATQQQWSLADQRLALQYPGC